MASFPTVVHSRLTFVRRRVVGSESTCASRGGVVAGVRVCVPRLSPGSFVGTREDARCEACAMWNRALLPVCLFAFPAAVGAVLEVCGCVLQWLWRVGSVEQRQCVGAQMSWCGGGGALSVSIEQRRGVGVRPSTGSSASCALGLVSAQASPAIYMTILGLVVQLVATRLVFGPSRVRIRQSRPASSLFSRQRSGTEGAPSRAPSSGTGMRATPSRRSDSFKAGGFFCCSVGPSVVRCLCRLCTSGPSLGARLGRLPGAPGTPISGCCRCGGCCAFAVVLRRLSAWCGVFAVLVLALLCACSGAWWFVVGLRCFQRRPHFECWPKLARARGGVFFLIPCYESTQSEHASPSPRSRF